MRVYYAQNKEDLLIKGFFPDIRNGFYIDIGAAHPVNDSVTKNFYDEGWSGINIDPIRKYIDEFNKLRPRDINLNIGVGEKTDVLNFTEYSSSDGLSTFDNSMREQYASNKDSKNTAKKHEYKVEVRTLRDIVEEYNVKHIHFLKIDVEGFEYEVLSGYDWSKIRPELICIEANHMIKDWRPLIEGKKYQLVHFDGINNYYLAEEAMNRKKHFNYPEVALFYSPIYYYTYNVLKESIEKYVQEQEKNKRDILNAKITDLEKRALFLEQQQRDVKFLAKRLHSEILIRINRRASANNARKALFYKEDSAVKELLINKDLTSNEILVNLHGLDKKNVSVKKTIVRGYYKSYLWKIVSKFYILFSRILRKIIPV